ncbi:MAG: hypothetical protein A4E55_01414 [Pelotomaculum sp. PtaU1.Bin035]|nr:MAG: hypothetical protein A4E55_01414 [Pelotomaculum sp. PtaU1.Bin035]
MKQAGYIYQGVYLQAAILSRLKFLVRVRTLIFGQSKDTYSYKCKGRCPYDKNL